MAESEFEQPQPPQQERMKTLLTYEDIGPREFLRELHRMDQHSNDHEQAYINLRVLQDEEVQRICTADEEVREQYYELLSISNFHAGQFEALYGTEDPTSYFKRAQYAAEEVNTHNAWIEYIRATVAYFSNNMSTLYGIYEGLSHDHPYAENIANLYNGLNQYGEPNYQRDYRS